MPRTADYTTSTRTGRPPKPGDRTRIDAWLPDALVKILRADADARRITMTDRLAEILAGHYATEPEGVLRRSA